MAKAIFTKAVGYTPAKGSVGWYAEPSAEPITIAAEQALQKVRNG